MSIERGKRRDYVAQPIDSARCRARIAGMQDEELEDYILRVKTRLVHSHDDSYFLEESLLVQLGEACDERNRRQGSRQAARERRIESSRDAGSGAASMGAD